MFVTKKQAHRVAKILDNYMPWKNNLTLTCVMDQKEKCNQFSVKN